ncbi:MAG: hypothetical protein JNL11_10395 [Bdellovibrionaceae bacterium]|nr:hypothetical protein [Pseudobdellovibrionaceae bacterium]
MSFYKSTRSVLFQESLALAKKNDFNGAKKMILDCVPQGKQAFLKDFEKFPEKVLSASKATPWLEENIAYGNPVPATFGKLHWNIAIGDDHVFYVDVTCLDAQNNPIKNMLNESMLVLEALSGEDYGCKRLSSDCDNWCEIGDKEIEGLQFKGNSIGSRTVYDAFASVVLLEYVFRLQKTLSEKSVFKKISYTNSVSSISDTGQRTNVA